MQDTLSNQPAQPKEAETVNLIENVPKTLSNAPCLVVKRMSLTLHLLLFKQSMSVLIVIVFHVSNPNERENIHKIKSSQWDDWFVYVFS